MTRSLATSPHAWTLQEADVTELVRYREAQKEGFQQRHGVPLTYLPFVVQVVLAQLEWRLVHGAMETMKRYIETVVLPAVRRAEHAEGNSSPAMGRREVPERPLL